jgi:hypothetical protein
MFLLAKKFNICLVACFIENKKNNPAFIKALQA